MRCWPQLHFLQQLCGQPHMWWCVRKSVRCGIGVARIVYKCQPQWHCHQLLSGHYRLQVPNTRLNLCKSLVTFVCAASYTGQTACFCQQEGRTGMQLFTKQAHSSCGKLHSTHLGRNDASLMNIAMFER